jgi:hypothetical protein
MMCCVLLKKKKNKNSNIFKNLVKEKNQESEMRPVRILYTSKGDAGQMVNTNFFFFYMQHIWKKRIKKR